MIFNNDIINIIYETIAGIMGFILFINNYKFLFIFLMLIGTALILNKLKPIIK